ncbi:23S rRNA pseudouridine(955/2504/2580) synthase RluC [Gynuella sp.]|uniref:23S rRNA pseudouridine(955/2504/2580) synthase RluC n=1 Tax=Gynuella sp. TaxID=2969146 RepID=UPI003D0D4CE8
MSGVQFITVQEDRAGQRLDNFLLSQLKGVPKSWVYRVIRKGEVRVNRKRCKPLQTLMAGDLIRIPPVRTSEAKAPVVIKPEFASSLESRVLFEDDGMLIINKPYGMAVHGGSGVSLGLIEALRAARPDAHFLELVHRLDKDTSGCLMVAKKRSFLKSLQQAIKDKTVAKIYQCLVVGEWQDNITKVTAPLLKLSRQSGERYVKVSPEGKSCLTTFEVLQRYRGYTLLKASPVTGRTHQIRVHCQFSRCPIVGDDKYCSEADLELARVIGLDRLFLHAIRLELIHPLSNERIVVEADPGEKWHAGVGTLERL